jgi:hypothetical protein
VSPHRALPADVLLRAREAAPILTVVALAAIVGAVGADAGWVAAMGDSVAAHGLGVHGVPFASAPTGHWPNAIVLAELVFGGIRAALGTRGLMLAQLACVAGGLAVLALDARADGAAAGGRGRAILIAGVGALSTLAIARLQMFSLVLFAVVLALLRVESRRPSRRVWLLLPVLALWSNLHGAALLGLGMVLVYLVIERARREPWTALAVALAAPVALCLTPAGLNSVSYYHGVLTNVAAQRGAGMWSGLSLTAPLDMVLVLAVGLLGLSLRRVRVRAWEWVVLGALAVASVHAARQGVWLLFVLVAPAARGLGSGALGRPLARVDLAPVAAVAAAALLAFALVRGPVAQGASPSMVARTVGLAGGTPVLASGGVDEQIALAGGRVWIGNPLDAFPRADQRRYVDWLIGSPAGRQALAGPVRVVLVAQDSAASRLMAGTPGFTVVARDRTALLYQRARPLLVAAR